MVKSRETAEPIRTCIVTRATLPPDAMVRFVLAPDGQVVPDLKRELPGRGVWVTAERALVADAVSKRLFARGFKQAARAVDDLADLVGVLLADRALGLLGFANRAGLVTTGFEKVAEQITRRRVAILVEARDGAADGRRKLADKLAASGQKEVETVEVFTGEQLSLALGRANVIHAALGQDRLTKAFLKAAHRYGHYVSATADRWRCRTVEE
ncbi:hypothetical protein FHS85_000648 [Rhodoligotrophos appendicifer]|uniref:RNA-binding protein n=1 Tax=Rhodoligotrophos appendicifer TaxID=987056 RepID=UPI00117F41FA|nr:RNA-binding protein [Rhodoligotrophos appendicifer]